MHLLPPLHLLLVEKVARCQILEKKTTKISIINKIKMLISIDIMVNIQKNIRYQVLNNSHRVHCRMFQGGKELLVVVGKKWCKFNKLSWKSTNFTRGNIKNSREVDNLGSTMSSIEWRRVSSLFFARILT